MQVYQHNVYPKNSKFHSFRSVLLSMGEKFARSVQIASFFSISKGYLGECALTNFMKVVIGLHLSVQYISKIRNMCKPTDTKYLRTFYRRCGMRGGYLELWNFPTDLRDQIYKFVSCKLCPPVPAQCAMDAVVNPPRPDEPSYATYTKVHLLLL